MLRVLVVDDEPRQRKILSNMIRAYRREYEVVEAKNGEEAYAICAESRMDMIFSDIRMPKLDGLDMIERISERSAFPKIVVVSGYNDFTYAQRAMDLRVYRYVLKPIEESKIHEIIVQIEEEISRERSSRREKEVMAHQINLLRPLYTEHLMNKWIRGECLPPELAEVKERLQFNESGRVILSRITLSESDSHSPYSTEDRNEIKWNVKTWIEEALGPYGHALSFYLQHDSHILVSLLHSSGDQADPDDPIRSKLEALAESLHREYGLSIALGIGQEIANFVSSIRQGYTTAEEALHCRFYRNDTVIDYSEIRHLYTREAKGAFPTEEELKRYVHGQQPLNESWISEGLESVLEGRYPTPELLLEYTRNLMLRVHHSTHHILPEEAYHRTIHRIKEALHPTNCTALSSLIGRLAELLIDMCAAVQLQKENKNNIVMERCLHHIHSQFNKDVSLDELASKFYFNPSYFSTLFKKYTGKHFTEYITDLRLESARRMLLESDKKVYVVAQEAGYKDVKYFNKVFKKRYGLTPDECRVFNT